MTTATVRRLSRPKKVNGKAKPAIAEPMDEPREAPPVPGTEQAVEDVQPEAEQSTPPVIPPWLYVVYSYVNHDGGRGFSAAKLVGLSDIITMSQLQSAIQFITAQDTNHKEVVLHNWKLMVG